MYLHRSNRAEVLVAELADRVSVPLGGPMQPECIVVQGKGMERWLSMELARRHGVWANPDFPFARSVIDRAFAAVLGKHAHQRWDSAALTWAIAEALLRMSTQSGFEKIRGYLEQDRDHSKLLQLSQRVAKVFDGYAVYRPELLRQWQEKPDPIWQSRLWHHLLKSHSFHHSSALESDFMKAIAAARGPISGFPERLSLFGIGSLPPLYLRIFAALASRIEVHLYVLSPSQEYWADIRTKREVLREELKGPQGESFEVGNTLLASLGRLHRDFQFVLERDVDYVELSETYCEPQRPQTVLGALQSDILHLRQRGRDAELLSVAREDHTLRVHSCHSPLRELEVLRDQILALMESDSTIEPRDVIVMSPDIESYAPFIDAVFSERQDGQQYLPFHIADRAPRSTYEVLDGFARLLDILPSRMPGPAVLDLLSTEVIRKRFGIEADELPTIQDWIAASGIRWARDAEHREAVGQPRSELNTWRFGLRRLLLGYASPASGSELFEGYLPYDDMEGGLTDLLGRFADFCEALFAIQDDFKRPHRVQDWQPLFERALESLLLSDDDNAAQHQLLRESFSGLREHAQSYGFEHAVSLAALLPLLSEAWHDRGTRSNFLSGGVSFCQLMPMRSIPHRIVCVVGMNDGAFPRSTQALAFDLVANSPRLGDRSPRDDDRYLFLEALLSARDALIITYTGQSNHTGQSMPGSVIIDELLDALDEGFTSASGGRASDQVLVQHPLQAFSPRYFDCSDSRLFSYSSVYCMGAQSLSGEREQEPPFLVAPIPPAHEAETIVRLSDLLRFFGRSSQYFVNQRLGLRLQESEEGLDSREPMELDGLARWQIGDTLLQAMLETGDAKRAHEALRVSGILPQGTPGLVHLQHELPLIQAIVDQARQYQEGGRLESIEVDLHLGPTRLVGQLDSLWTRCRQEISYSSMAGRRELSAWIKHLVLCHQTPEGYPRNTVSVGREGNQVSAISFRPVADSGPRLRELLALYALAQQVPLPLFLQSSRTYAQHWSRSRARDEDASDDDSMQAARKAYLGSEFGRGPRPDLADPYVKALFADADPLVDEYRPVEELPEGYQSFKMIAMQVFGPLLDHREPIVG